MTTSTARSQRTLAELVAEKPARAVVLDQIGLDFCCHGNRSLSDACSEAGLDPAEVTAAAHLGRLDIRAFFRERLGRLKD